MKRGMEKGGGEEWSPADTHVCSVFHNSGVYPVKIHSSLRTIIKRVILIFFPCLRTEVYIFGRKNTDI